MPKCCASASVLLSRHRLVTLRPISAQDTIHLRHTVLWPDRPKAYVLLPEDDTGLHFGAFLRGAEPELVSVISFFLEDLPGVAELPHGKTARFRKFATASDHRGRGLGSRLFAFAKAEVKKAWAAEYCWCDARVASMGWYVKRGLHEVGEGQERFYKGDIPYLKMAGPLEG